MGWSETPGVDRRHVLSAKRSVALRRASRRWLRMLPLVRAVTARSKPLARFTAGGRANVAQVENRHSAFPGVEPVVDVTAWMCTSERRHACPTTPRAAAHRPHANRQY